MAKNPKKIILASTSPRRKELLKKLGIRFRAVAGNYSEDMTVKMPPKRLAVFLSGKKAGSVRNRFPGSVIIAADTIVVLGKKVLGKPHTRSKAREMLSALSGKKHSVITGFTIIDGARKKIISGYEESKVYFRELSSAEIARYVNSGEPLDKAGAYAIQGRGGLFIRRIDGDYYNVVGFPLLRIADALKKSGVRTI